MRRYESYSADDNILLRNMAAQFLANRWLGLRIPVRMLWKLQGCTILIPVDSLVSIIFFLLHHDMNKPCAKTHHNVAAYAHNTVWELEAQLWRHQRRLHAASWLQPCGRLQIDHPWNGYELVFHQGQVLKFSHVVSYW